MAITKFEDIISWQKAQDLAVEVYKDFRDSRDFGFRDQICRASVSVSNNIAEGFDRNTKNEFRKYLGISSASCGEVRSMLYLAERLRFIEKGRASELRSLTLEISKMNRALSNSIK